MLMVWMLVLDLFVAGMHDTFMFSKKKKILFRLWSYLCMEIAWNGTNWIAYLYNCSAWTLVRGDKTSSVKWMK